MVNISLFTGFPTCWAVQDFFHQQYFFIFSEQKWRIRIFSNKKILLTPTLTEENFSRFFLRKFTRFAFYTPTSCDPHLPYPPYPPVEISLTPGRFIGMAPRMTRTQIRSPKTKTIVREMTVTRLDFGISQWILVVVGCCWFVCWTYAGKNPQRDSNIGFEPQRQNEQKSMCDITRHHSQNTLLIILLQLWKISGGETYAEVLENGWDKMFLLEQNHNFRTYRTSSVSFRVSCLPVCHSQCLDNCWHEGWQPPNRTRHLHVRRMFPAKLSLKHTEQPQLQAIRPHVVRPEGKCHT